MEALTTARMVHDILDSAIQIGGTDVHMVLLGSTVTVSCRVNGKATSIAQFLHLGEELIRRFKALARLDVTTRHTPQEGSFAWETATSRVRIRISCVPIYGGESIVLRILPSGGEVKAFEDLGFTRDQLATLERWMYLESGMIVISGRTGVGKTTTLYSFMEEYARRGRQVFSIEDPVEIPLPHCRQIEIHQRSAFGYAEALRALLRQDPDVVMIGEIRDFETAHVACQAALTGRLVLATTHADGREGTVRRLVDLGVEQVLVHDVLRGVIVQRQHGRNDALPVGGSYVLESAGWLSAQRALPHSDRQRSREPLWARDASQGWFET